MVIPRKPFTMASPRRNKNPKREVLLLGLPHCTGCKVIVGHSVEGSFILPIGSMYAIYANIGGILMVNATIYSIHGSYGLLTGDINDMIPIPKLTQQFDWRKFLVKCLTKHHRVKSLPESISPDMNFPPQKRAQK